MNNAISSSDVFVTFYPSNISYIFLNEYNFGIITFKSKNKSNINNLVNFNKETEQIKNGFIFNRPKLEFYDLKYIKNKNKKNSLNLYFINIHKIFVFSCFKEMKKIGSSCLKLGLQCFTTLPQTFFAFDNILITGEYKIKYFDSVIVGVIK